MLYATGIALGNWLPCAPVPLCLITIMAAGAGMASHAVRSRLLPGIAVLTGALAYHCDSAVWSELDLRKLTGRTPCLVNVEGKLCHRPALRTFENKQHLQKVRATTEIEVERIQFPGEAWHPATGRILAIAGFEPDDSFHGGAAVRITGTLSEPSAAVAPGLFDFRDHLKRLNIHRILNARETADWTRLGSFDPKRDIPWGERFEAWARRTLARGLEKEDDALRLTWAMALGWKTALTDEVTEPFLKTGTMHIFAISGLHVALFAGILVQLLGAVRVPRSLSGLIIIPTLFFYTAATGWQASAIRAAVMMSVIVLSWSLKRPTSLLNSLGGSALMILATDPQQLFQPGFQLSFVVVLSLALLQSRLGGWHHCLAAPDPFLPERLQPKWKTAVRVPLRWLDQSFSVSLAAWIGSLPLVCEDFNLISPSGLLANLIIVPISDLALMSQLGSLICGDWLPSPGVLFNHSAWFWMELMIRSSSQIASWSWSSFHVKSPGPVGLGLLYAIIMVWALDFPRPAFKKWILAGLASAGLTWMIHSFRDQQHRVVVSVLEMEGGYGCYVDFPGRADDTLVNCGNPENARRVIVPWLHSQGRDDLPLVLIQQGDLAHAGGLELLVKTVPPARILAPDAPFRSSPVRKMSSTLSSNGFPMIHVSAGQSWRNWRFLNPAAGQKPRQNDDSALAGLLSWGPHRILFCGNLGRIGQAGVVNQFPELEADVIIAGIPARDEPLPDQLLENTGTKTVILIDREQQSRRAGEIEARLRSRMIEVIRIQKSGTVQLQMSGGKITVQSWREAREMRQ